ncbi:hypothetical protein GQ457_14G026500 [Hibiscus cannabinus]
MPFPVIVDIAPTVVGTYQSYQSVYVQHGVQSDSAHGEGSRDGHTNQANDGHFMNSGDAMSAGVPVDSPGSVCADLDQTHKSQDSSACVEGAHGSSDSRATHSAGTEVVVSSEQAGLRSSSEDEPMVNTSSENVDRHAMNDGEPGDVIPGEGVKIVGWTGAEQSRAEFATCRVPHPAPVEKRGQDSFAEETNKNQAVVLALYDALNTRDVHTVHKILAPDLEWWFHGPPTHQFLMRLLTGASPDDSDSFRFDLDPLSLTTFGSTVIVEGCDHARSISWVHAWTVTDGIITQVKEYFNTSLTVTRLGPSAYGSSSTAEITPAHCPSVWESSFSNQVGKSVPGKIADVFVFVLV